jgi:hypothetical protein
MYLHCRSPELYSISCQLKCVCYFGNFVLQTIAVTRAFCCQRREAYPYHTAAATQSAQLRIVWVLHDAWLQRGAFRNTSSISHPLHFTKWVTKWILMKLDIGVPTRKCYFFNFAPLQFLMYINKDQIEVIEFCQKKFSLYETLAHVWLIICTRLPTHETWNQIETNLN